MFYRIKVLTSGMYNSGSEEWYDNVLYKSKESANEFLECLITEHGYTKTPNVEDEVQKITDMWRKAYRIETFYPKEYVIVD